MFDNIRELETQFAGIIAEVEGRRAAVEKRHADMKAAITQADKDMEEALSVDNLEKYTNAKTKKEAAAAIAANIERTAEAAQIPKEVCDSATAKIGAAFEKDLEEVKTRAAEIINELSEMLEAIQDEIYWGEKYRSFFLTAADQHPRPFEDPLSYREAYKIVSQAIGDFNRKYNEPHEMQAIRSMNASYFKDPENGPEYAINPQDSRLYRREQDKRGVYYYIEHRAKRGCEPVKIYAPETKETKPKRLFARG